MISKGELVIQRCWTDEPDQWRDYEAIGDMSPAGDQVEYLTGSARGHGPRPGVELVFRVGPALEDHPLWR